MATVIPSTPTPTVVTSVGPPLSTGIVTTSTNSFITTLPTVITTTFGISQPSNSATSPLSPAIPSSSGIGANSDDGNSNNNNNNQSYPIGLIAGIVTGFAILMLVMGVLFIVLWRHKKTKVISDSEAFAMRGPRSAVPFYYVPPAPAHHHYQHKPIESEASSPVRSARFAPEPEVVMTPPPPPPHRAPDSPRRSGDLNKPWPPTPRAMDDDVASDPPYPFPLTPSSRGVKSATTPPAAPPMAYPGRASNLPDPLRADGRVPVPTGSRAVRFTPSSEALFQPQQSFVSHSPRDSHRSSYTPTIPDSGPAAFQHITSTADYERAVRRNIKSFSELTRTDSTSHALSAPPRRPKTSDSEASESTGEGKISRTPGLRLSGVSRQGTVGPGGQDKRKSIDVVEAAQKTQRITSYGEGRSHDSGASTTPSRSGK
ncbi:hypothetical protein N0V82_010377 [Gnomoniopsis sp. IMI 355080]|nr:hypothetical protein N0V82_010377 [Gnomoniopsis sp. IMI 355080]